MPRSAPPAWPWPACRSSGPPGRWAEGPGPGSPAQGGHVVTGPAVYLHEGRVEAGQAHQARQTGLRLTVILALAGIAYHLHQACPLRIFWGRNIADKPKNLSDQLPQKLSSPYPIIQLPQKFVQLPYLQQKFANRGHKSHKSGHKSPAAEEICTL